MTVTDTHVLFWGGVLSNFYRVDGDPGRTSEKIFMINKAVTFNDKVSFEKINACNDPMQCKMLGRKVKGYKQEVWDQRRYPAMMNALLWKYGGCEKFRDTMTDTGNKIIVEASPDDRIWGIGFSEADAMDNESDWGLNLLGKCLMELRERVKTIV